MDLRGQLTQRGSELRLLALSGGASLRYTRVTAGSGATAQNASALAEERQALPMSALRYTDSSVILPVTLVAAEAEQEYSLTELGVYVQDGEGESLYCVYRANAEMIVSPASAMSVRIELEEVSAELPDISVTPAGLVTEPELEAMKGAPGGIAALDDGAAVPMAQLPFTFGTEDLTAGESALESGTMHFVYE